MGVADCQLAGSSPQAEAAEDNRWMDEPEPSAATGRAGSGTLTTNSDPVRIGDNSYFNGLMDNVMIYKEALTDAQVYALYKSQSDNVIDYDAAGNLIADKDGYLYTYDYENRIATIAKGDGGSGYYNMYDNLEAVFLNTSFTIKDEGSILNGVTPGIIYPLG